MKAFLHHLPGMHRNTATEIETPEEQVDHTHSPHHKHNTDLLDDETLASLDVYVRVRMMEYYADKDPAMAKKLFLSIKRPQLEVDDSHHRKSTPKAA